MTVLLKTFKGKFSGKKRWQEKKITVIIKQSKQEKKNIIQYYITKAEWKVKNNK